MSGSFGTVREVPVGHLPEHEDPAELRAYVACVSSETAERITRLARLRLALREWLESGCKGPRPKLAPQPKRRSRYAKGSSNRQTVTSEFAGAVAALSKG